MSIVMAKIRKRGRSEDNKYRKMLSTEIVIYGNRNSIVESSCIYTAGATLENGEWFYVENAKEQPYALDLFNHNYQTVDFDSLRKSDFNIIDYLIVQSGDDLFFQNVTKARLVSKKSIIRSGENFEYNNNRQEIVINDLPDAIYVFSENRLYFRKLESITSIFKGIDQLYREATNAEVDDFLGNDFISLQDEYCTSKVKTANRKRIALAKKTLDELDETDKKKVFDYIGDYCPDLKSEDNSFKIGSEDELKMLLYGIEQRFYTTPVGGEKRLANSVIPLNN